MNKKNYMLNSWGVPNAMIRSSLFSTKSLGISRSTFKKSIECQKGYSITYEGEELNQYDCQVLYAIFHVQKERSVDFGSNVSVYQKDLASLTGKTPSGENFDQIYKSAARLARCNLTVTVDIGKSVSYYHGHILEAVYKNRGHIVFRLNPDLSTLFDDDCTIILLRHKVALTRLLSKWLYDFASSHDTVYPYTIERLMQICGTNGTKYEFQRQLKAACQEIVSTLSKDSPFVDFEIKSGKLHLYKQMKKSHKENLSVNKSEEEIDYSLYV
jgi:hypothetical protein